MFSLSRWRPRHLLMSWVAYWIVLLAVTLGPAALAALPVLADKNGHGTINASFSDFVVSLTITHESTTVWHGSAHMLAIALWIAGPPLILWSLWMSRRARPEVRAAPSAPTL